MYANGVVSVGTAATLICTPGPDGVMVQNLGTAVVTLGAATVTAGTATLATGGISLGTAMAAPVLIATGLRAGTLTADEGLYGRVAGGTSNVAFLAVV